jgi:hypothetical protein
MRLRKRYEVLLMRAGAGLSGHGFRVCGKTLVTQDTYQYLKRGLRTKAPGELRTGNRGLLQQVPTLKSIFPSKYAAIGSVLALQALAASAPPPKTWKAKNPWLQSHTGLAACVGHQLGTLFSEYRALI